MPQPNYYRGLPVPDDVTRSVRDLVGARGAQNAVRMMGLSPLAIASLAAGSFVTPATLERARHFIEHGSPMPRPERPEAQPEPSSPRSLPQNVISLAAVRRVW